MVIPVNFSAAIGVSISRRKGNYNEATKLRQQLAAIAEAATIFDRRTGDLTGQLHGLFLQSHKDGPINFTDPKSGDNVIIEQTVPLAIGNTHTLQRGGSVYDGGLRYRYVGVPNQIVGRIPVYVDANGGKSFSYTRLMDMLWAESNASWARNGHGLRYVNFTKPGIRIQITRTDGTIISCRVDPMKSGVKRNELNAVRKLGKPESKWDPVEVSDIQAFKTTPLAKDAEPPKNLVSMRDPDSGIGFSIEPISLKAIPNLRSLLRERVDMIYHRVAKEMGIQPGDRHNNYEYDYQDAFNPKRKSMAFQYRYNLGEYDPKNY